VLLHKNCKRRNEGRNVLARYNGRDGDLRRKNKAMLQQSGCGIPQHGLATIAHCRISAAVRHLSAAVLTGSVQSHQRLRAEQHGSAHCEHNAHQRRRSLESRHEDILPLVPQGNNSGSSLRRVLSAGSYFCVIRTIATTISTIRPTAIIPPKIHIQQTPFIGIWKNAAMFTSRILSIDALLSHDL
jgi:hypothetical protein